MMIAVVVYVVAMTLLCLVICADSKRREQAHVRLTVFGPARDNQVADALADALEAHMDAGGQLVDVAGYTLIDHPCGKTVLRLVLAGDAVAGAEEILRAGGEG